MNIIVPSIHSIDDHICSLSRRDKVNIRPRDVSAISTSSILRIAGSENKKHAGGIQLRSISPLLDETAMSSTGVTQPRASNHAFTNAIISPRIVQIAEAPRVSIFKFRKAHSSQLWTAPKYMNSPDQSLLPYNWGLSPPMREGAPRMEPNVYLGLQRQC